MSKSFTKLFVIILAGLMIFLLYLYLTVGVNEMLSVLQEIDLSRYLLYYAIALAAVFLSMLFYSLSWNELMKALGIKIGVKKVYMYCWIGNFVDSITPFETVAGEITRMYLVQRDTNESMGRIVASIVAHRIISAAMALGGLVISLIFLTATYSVSSSMVHHILTLILCLIALILLLLLVSLKEGLAEKIINPILNFVSFISRGRINILETKKIIYTNLQYFYNDFRSLSSNLPALVRAIFYSFTAWLLHLSIFFLTFYAINFPEIIHKIYETIVVYSVYTSLQASPISLAPGLIEIIMTNLYVILGFNMAIGGVATLLMRIAMFWLPLIFGGAVAQWVGVKNLFTQVGKNTSTC